jgi:crotonobetainyl-CoA:carnitine CoA-transferase CaiB-like acyl-CoA transferase
VKTGGDGPLTGVRILDLTAVVMGPFATQMLGDMGADVIKIESPAGDLARDIGPRRNDRMGALFLNLNRNKRSVVLDLKRPEGREAILRLVRDADVMIHSMRPQAIERLGLGYDAIRAVNPEVVYCAAYGFGQDGPYAARPAFDDVIQGASGASAVQAFSTGEPRHFPMLFCDKTTGYAALSAISLALFHKARTGSGQKIDIPMFETMVHFNLLEHQYGQIFDPPLGDFGHARVRAPDRRPLGVEDGHVCVMPYTDAHWRGFFEAVGRPDLAKDPRVADGASRAAHVEELYALIADLVQDKSRDALLDALVAADVPCAPVNTLPDLFEDPHLASVNFFQPVDHPTEGRMRVASNPMGFSETPAAIRRPAPRLGEHSVEVLQEAGFDDQEIGSLLKAGAAMNGNA